MSSRLRNIGSYISGRIAIPNLAMTAGGSGDSSEVSGPSFDRLALADPLSGKVILFGRGTLASGETLVVQGNLQDSANDSDWSDYGDALALTTVLDAAGGALTNSPWKAELDIDLSGARQYVRFQATGDLSRGGTDTAELAACFALGGFAELPPAV